MSNNTKIRTMQDDLKEIKSSPVTENEQKKSAPEAVSKKTQQPSTRLNTAQPVQPDISQTVRSGAQQQSPKAPIRQQNDKLKELIEKISAQTDKDPDNKYQIKEKENIASKETEIVDDLAGENEIKPAKNKKDIIKEITNETTEQRASDKNVDDIDTLKNLIHRISEPNPITEEKSENKAGNLENAKEKNTANSATSPLPRQPEKNIRQDLAGKKPTKTKQVETEKIIAPPVSQEIKSSFWKKISGKMKKVSDSEKINALSGKNKLSDIKTSDNSKTEKYSNQSGILRNNKDAKQKEAHKENTSSKKAYYDKNYMSPDERLIHGKQKFYSSVSKRIKLKEEKDELKDLEDAARMKKQEKIVTKEEEYKKLKQGIIQKYHIKISSMPWKKIVPVALVALLLTGTVSWLVFSYIKPPAPPAPPALVIGSELEEFSSVEKEITMAKKDLKGFNSLEVDALTIFNSDENVKIIKLITVDNETDKNILSLREALDTMGIINIGENISYLPDGFLQATTDNYNLFLFKTERNSIRYGLAVKINDERSMSELMRKWEKEESKNKRMTTIFKPLFGNDRNFEDVFSPLLTTIYRNVEIRYISLIDKETALDYFIHKNILVFTTSKDSAFTMVDLLTLDE